MRQRSMRGQGGATAPSAPTPPPWPLSAPNLQYLHPGMARAGTDADVSSITFSTGLTMTAVGNVAGNGDTPIQWTADGPLFNEGRCFRYVPSPAVEFDAVAMFARIRRTDTDKQWGLTPIELIGLGENVLDFDDNQGRLLSDLGSTTLMATNIAGRSLDQFVVGVYLNPDDPGRTKYQIWINGFRVGARPEYESVKPTAWRIGRGLRGVMEEAVTFTRRVGETHDLLPPGVTPQWICDQLAGAD